MKALLLICSLVLTACVALSYDDEKPITVVGFTSEEAVEYHVRVDFVMFKDEMIKYPLAAKAVMDSIVIWSGVVPIEAHVLIEDRGPFPWLTMGTFLPSDVPGVVKIHLEQLDEKPWGGHPDLAGAWLWDTRNLYIDAPDVIDPDHLHQIALHELGHALGLTHVVPVNRGDIGVTGDISVREDAESYLMYPQLSDDNVYSMPSSMEASIARQYVLEVMTHPGGISMTDYFCLTEH